MAQTVAIRDYQATAKIRNPWGVLGLGIVTFGIYLICWWYFINRELRDIGVARNDERFGKDPAMSTLAYALGGFLLYIPTVITIVRTTQRVQHAQRTAGAPELNGVVAALLWIFTLTLGGFVYTQMQLNAALRTGALAESQQGQLEGGGGFIEPAGSGQAHDQIPSGPA